MADKIQLRRDTSANWTSANPTLAQGEMGIETNTLKMKIGDGVTAWASLAYYSSMGSHLVRGTFTNTNLASHILTITHNFALSAPYAVVVFIFNNNNLVINPDNITGATNTVLIDLTGYGTLSGTWGYEVIG